MPFLLYSRGFELSNTAYFRLMNLVDLIYVSALLLYVSIVHPLYWEIYQFILASFLVIAFISFISFSLGFQSWKLVHVVYANVRMIVSAILIATGIILFIRRFEKDSKLTNAEIVFWVTAIFEIVLGIYLTSQIPPDPYAEYVPRAHNDDYRASPFSGGNMP